MANQTTLEPKLLDGKQLPIMEAFYTIQGEGIHSGRPAYFLRLAGCDVGCTWCDVKESWNAQANQLQSIESIVDDALQYPSRFIVITGGEPAMYSLKPLTDLLKANGFEIAIETSGAYLIQGNFDWICVSPKKFKTPLPESLQLANELKVVIYHESDFSWAEQHRNKINTSCQLLLQPEYSRFERVLPLILDYCKLNPAWRISLQTHKVMNIP